MITIFHIHDPIASPFNSRAIALAGIKLIDGDRIDYIILNNDNVLPPPSIDNDLLAILIGLKLLCCSWLLKVGVRKNISYPVHKKTFKNFKVFWRSNLCCIDIVGKGYARVGDQIVPRWIGVFNMKFYFYGVMPSSGNIATDIQILSENDFIHLGCIYRSKNSI